jgi:hypothetical protein
MREDFSQNTRRLQPPIIEMAKAVESGHIAGGRVEAIILLELAGKLFGQHDACGADEALEAAARSVVKCHRRSILADDNVERGVCEGDAE